MGIEKEKNTFYITHSGELLIWLIIALVFISIFTFIYFKNVKSANDYNIFMPDVDGLIVGSPVRMMGIEVGHITKIKPTKDEVYIKFIIYDKDLVMPQGTRATVEFSGMAGSKSLELYLPDKTTYVDKNVPILMVNPPKRLHDALGLLNEMFEKLGSIIYTTSDFGEKIKSVEFPSGEAEDFEKFVEYADDMVDDANKKAEDLERKINGVRKNGEK